LIGVNIFIEPPVVSMGFHNTPGDFFCDFCCYSLCILCYGFITGTERWYPVNFWALNLWLEPY